MPTNIVPTIQVGTGKQTRVIDPVFLTGLGPDGQPVALAVDVDGALAVSGGASATKQDDTITAINRSGTREYNVAAITRQAVGVASARVALPTLGASRELYVMGSARLFFKTGDVTVVAAAGTSHPLAADERFHLRIPASHTHICYIRDTTDGFINIVPTAV